MIGPEYHGGGHPWHGISQDGELTLPNADTKIYPQPAGGDCFKLVVPGFTAPVRSGAQLADDAARGLSWLDHALLSGDSRAAGGLQVYGKPLGAMRWIWAISPSEKWRVDASALVVAVGTNTTPFPGTLSGNLVLTRFGIQQPGVAGTVLTLPVSAPVGCVASIAMRLLDMSAAGDKVIVGFYAEPDGLRYADPMRPLPVAVVEIALTMVDAVPAASVTSRYTRFDSSQTSRPILYKVDGGLTPYLNVDSVNPGSGSPIEFYIRLHVQSSGGAIVAKLGIRAAISSTNTSGSTVVDFVPPTYPVRLAGSDVSACSGGNTPVAYDYSYTGTSLADIEAQAATLKSVRENEISAFYLTNITDCAGAVVQPNVYDPPDTNPLSAHGYIWDHSVQSVQNVVSETDVNGVVIRRYAQYSLYESFTSRAYGINGIPGQTDCTVTDGGTITHTQILWSSTAHAYYFKKTTTPTGAISYRVWAGLLACETPQYLSAPDLGSTGSGAYTYLVNAQLFLQVEGVEVADLGAFSYTRSAGAPLPAAGIRAFIINQGLDMTDIGEVFSNPVPGKHDRFAVVLSDLPTPVAEVLFANPCAGVVAFALRNMVPGTTQKQWYLHKLVRLKDGTSQAWSGWSDFSVYDHSVTLHPETGEIQAIPNKSVCFV